MLYRIEPATATSPVAAEKPFINGAVLARNRHSPGRAAGITAQILLGEKILRPTTAQACGITGATFSSVQRAKRASPQEREQLARGDLLLSEIIAPPKTTRIERFLRLWNSMTSAEGVVAGRDIGIDRVWNGPVPPPHLKLTLR